MQINYSRATVYSLVGYFLFGVGAVITKLIIASYPPSQFLFIESLVCLPLYLVMALFCGGLKTLKTHYPVMQLNRGLLQTASAYAGLFGLGLLPVATYTMLGYATPFIVAVLALVFLREAIPRKSGLVIIGGFFGVVLITQPELANSLTGVAAVLLSCVMWGGNIILMRKMPKDHTMVFPFYTLLFVGAISAIVLAVTGFKPMPLHDVFLVGCAGVFYFGGAQFLFASYRQAPLHFTMPFQYTQLIWVTLFGYWIWHYIPDPIQLCGLAIVVATALYLSIVKERQIE